jgi:hypothetical protein
VTRDLWRALPAGWNRPAPGRQGLALVTLLALTGFAVPVHPQPPGEEMVLREIAGRRYERISYDTSGTATGRVLIKVGKLQRSEDEIVLPVTVTPYSDQGKPKQSHQTLWRCHVGQGHMVMPVLFMSQDAGSEVGLEVEGDPVAYPEFPPPQKLPDLRLKIDIRKGFVSFLGGRSVVLLSDRRVKAYHGPPDARYTVEAKVEVKVFVLGIRVKHMRFDSEVRVQKGQGLVHQTLTSPDGSYSVFRNLAEDETPADGTPPSQAESASSLDMGMILGYR